MNFSTFLKAVDQLGATNKARAAALGVSETTYYEIKRGNFPEYLRRLVKHPELAEALAADARALANHPAEVTQ